MNFLKLDDGSETLIGQAERIAEQLETFAKTAADSLLQNAQAMIQSNFVLHLTIMFLTIMLGIFLFEKVKKTNYKTILIALSAMGAVIMMPQLMFLGERSYGLLHGVTVISAIFVIACLAYNMLCFHKSVTKNEEVSDHVAE